MHSWTLYQTVLGTTLPELSSFECYLSRSVRITLALLRSGHCWLLNSYKARITAGVTDFCPNCGVALHSVEHLFQCPACPTQLTTQDLWDDPDAVADFLMKVRRRGAVGYNNNNIQDHFPWLWPDFSKIIFFPDFPWQHKFPDIFQFALTCRNPAISLIISHTETKDKAYFAEKSLVQ